MEAEIELKPSSGDIAYWVELLGRGLETDLSRKKKEKEHGGLDDDALCFKILMIQLAAEE